MQVQESPECDEQQSRNVLAAVRTCANEPGSHGLDLSEFYDCLVSSVLQAVTSDPRHGPALLDFVHSFVVHAKECPTKECWRFTRRTDLPQDAQGRQPWIMDFLQMTLDLYIMEQDAETRLLDTRRALMRMISDKEYRDTPYVDALEGRAECNTAALHSLGNALRERGLLRPEMPPPPLGDEQKIVVYPDSVPGILTIADPRLSEGLFTDVKVLEPKTTMQQCMIVRVDCPLFAKEGDTNASWILAYIQEDVRALYDRMHQMGIFACSSSIELFKDQRAAKGWPGASGIGQLGCKKIGVSGKYRFTVLKVRCTDEDFKNCKESQTTRVLSGVRVLTDALGYLSYSVMLLLNQGKGEEDKMIGSEEIGVYVAAYSYRFLDYILNLHKIHSETALCAQALQRQVTFAVLCFFSKMCLRICSDLADAECCRKKMLPGAGAWRVQEVKDVLGKVLPLDGPFGDSSTRGRSA